MRKIIRKLTPKSWHLRLKTIYSSFSKISDFIRVQKPITKMLGRKWKRSLKLIEIDITHDCNLKCLNCCRSCKQAPTNEEMTVDQIKKFVKESIDKKANWEMIRVMGGEPTLHQNLIEILNILAEYKKNHSPETKIELVTNGFGNTLNKISSKIPKEIIIHNTAKKLAIQHFYKFNLAPKDSKKYKYADFSNGCPAICNVGIGLNRYGYYACANCGAIDRVMGLNIGRKKLPSSDDLMRDQLDACCRYCGIFGYGSTIRSKKEVMSPSWKKAYEKYKKEKPSLPLY